MKKKLYTGLLSVAFLVCAFNVFSQGEAVRSDSINKSKIELDYAIYASQLVVDSKWTRDPAFNKRFNWKNGGGRFYQVLYSGEIKNDIIIFAGLAFNMVDFVQTAGFWFKPIDPAKYGATDVVSISRKINLNSVEFPIGILKEFRVRKFEFRTGIGVRTMLNEAKYESIDYNLNNGSIVSSGKKNLIYSHHPQINISFEIKAGLTYRVLKRLSLKFEPFYRISLWQDEILHFFSDTRISGLGVLFGMEYPFKFNN